MRGSVKIVNKNDNSTGVRKRKPQKAENQKQKYYVIIELSVDLCVVISMSL